MTMTAPKHFYRRRARQLGFSMIEVMVAVVILSTALLALTLLQVISLRGSGSAYSRSEAVVLSYDIADRMRANRPAAIAGSYDVTMAQAGTAGTRAGDDIVLWKNTLAASATNRAGLPAGNGSITVASGVATITIEWLDNSMKAAEDQTTSTTTNAQFVLRTTL